MSGTIECFFDVGSPASYLAWTQLPGLAARHHATIEWKPMLLGGVFQATGNQSPAAIPAKGRYSRIDLQRFARDYGVALNFNPYFPVNTLTLMRGATAYLETSHFPRYLNTIFTAMWVNEQDLGQPEVVASVLKEAGFDAAEVLRYCADQGVKDRLKQLTTEAVDRGVFGAPTMFVGDQMFFGQDRLQHVEKALQAG